MRSLGQDPSEEELRGIIDEVDVDGEFYSVFAKTMSVYGVSSVPPVSLFLVVIQCIDAPHFVVGNVL